MAVVEEEAAFPVVAVEVVAFPAVAAAFREAARQVVDLSEAAVRQADRAFRPAARPAAVLSAALDRRRAEGRAWPRADLARPAVLANPAGREELRECKAVLLVVSPNPAVPEEATRPPKAVRPAVNRPALRHRVAVPAAHRLQVVAPPAHRLQVARLQALTMITGMTTGDG